MARPRKILDETLIVEKAKEGWTLNEIAIFMGVSDDTISRNYAEAVKRGKLLLNGSLRARQVKVAMEGNPTMLIWLGKQLLDQKDKSEVDVNEQRSIDPKSLAEILARAAEASGSVHSTEPVVASGRVN